MPKQYLIFLLGLLLCCSLEGCKPDPAPLENGRHEEEVDLWPKDSVFKMVRTSLWRVQNVYHVNGNDTVNLAETGFTNRYFPERHEVVFGFYDDYLPIWPAGKATKDNEGKFRKPAEIHLFVDRSIDHSGVFHNWNDSLNTLELKPKAHSWLNIPTNHAAYLEKSKIVVYKSYQEEEKASRPSCMVYRVNTDFGTYLFELRQVWRFQSHPAYQHFNYYVVFP